MRTEFVGNVQEGQEKRVSDDFGKTAVVFILVNIAVGEEKTVFMKLTQGRLLFDGNDVDVGKKLLQVEVVIALEIDNFDTTGECVDEVDSGSVKCYGMADLPDKQVEHIAHQKELRGFDAPRVELFEKAVKVVPVHVGVCVGEENRAILDGDHGT